MYSFSGPVLRKLMRSEYVHLKMSFKTKIVKSLPRKLSLSEFREFTRLLTERRLASC